MTIDLSFLILSVQWTQPFFVLLLRPTTMTHQLTDWKGVSKISLHAPHDLLLPPNIVFSNFYQFLEGGLGKGGFDVVVFCGVFEVFCDDLDPCSNWSAGSRLGVCGASNKTALLSVQVCLPLWCLRPTSSRRMWHNKDIFLITPVSLCNSA